MSEQRHQSVSDHRLQDGHLVVSVLTLLAALAGLAFAVAGWLKPYQPVTPSPLDMARPPELRIECFGAHIDFSTNRWQIAGHTVCHMTLLESETLVGSALAFNNSEGLGPCVAFAFSGPTTIKSLALSDVVMTLHSAAQDQGVAEALLEGAVKDLRGRLPRCDELGIVQYQLPYVPVSSRLP